MRGKSGCGHTLLLVDLHLHHEVQTSNDQVADNVESAAHVEDIGVVEGDLLRDLHRPEDDDEVLTTESHPISFNALYATYATGPTMRHARINGQVHTFGG